VVAPKRVAHQHRRHQLAPAPIPQPDREMVWHCRCGAVEFDTYPVGPDGDADTCCGPIGLAWVEPEQIRPTLKLP
jgi:hypothetical protein